MCALLSCVYAQEVYFYSLRNQYSSSLLPLGFNLEEAGLAQASGDPFPAGLQFLFASSTSLPLSSARSSGSQELFDFLQDISAGIGERLHYLLMAEQSLPALEAQGQRFPRSVDAFKADPDADAFFGSWTLWLDADDTIANLTAPKTIVGGRESRAGTAFYACSR